MFGFMMGGMGGQTASAKKPEEYDIVDSMIIERKNPEKKRSLSEVAGAVLWEEVEP